MLMLPCTVRGWRCSVQEIADQMNLDTESTANSGGTMKHDCDLHCAFCAEEAGHEANSWDMMRSVQPTRHTLRLGDSGPTHFLAQAHDRNVRYAGDARREGVTPSLTLRIFGSSYSLCAVVYWNSSSAHFVCQAFLPKEVSWVQYNDMQGRPVLPSGPHFDETFHAGDAHTFLYIKTSIVDWTLRRKSLRHSTIRPMSVSSEESEGEPRFQRTQRVVSAEPGICRSGLRIATTPQLRTKGPNPKHNISSPTWTPWFIIQQRRLPATYAPRATTLETILGDITPEQYKEVHTLSKLWQKKKYICMWKLPRDETS